MSGDALYTFDYSVWTPNTNICLCSVPWDNSYRDVVSFDSSALRDAYFSAQRINGNIIELDHLVYLRYGEPIRLALPFSIVNRNNYIVVKNQKQPIPDYGYVDSPDTFYYFINDVRYIAPNCTELDIQLDVWMTYYDRVSYDVCYVERGHIGIANENANGLKLRDYMIEPEGLEQGRYYVTRHTHFENFLDESPWVVVMTSADLTADFGSVNKPNLETSHGGVYDGLPNGCSCYAMDALNFNDFCKLVSDAPWISQCTMMITVIPRPLIDVQSEPVKLGNIVTAYPLARDPYSGTNNYDIGDGFEHMEIPERYKTLLKFYTYPYSVVEVTAFNGSTFSFSLDEVNNPYSLVFDLRNICNPPNIRSMIYAEGINVSISGSWEARYQTLYDEQRYIFDSGGDSIERAIIYENFPQCAIVNNQYISYLASTANTRAFQQQSAEWTQQKALTGAQLAFNQSSAATANMLSNTGLSNSAAWANTGFANERVTWGAIQNGINSAAGAIGSAASRDAGGVLSNAGSALMGAVDASMNIGWNNAQTGISTGLASATAANNARLANYNRDTNYDYAQYAAKGDYQNTIAAIQAKVSDAAITPPSVSATTGGDGFNIANGYCGFAVKFKTPPDQFIVQIGEYWLRYGYAINRFLTPPQNLKCMSKFTYWKMQNVMIRAAIPEVHKNAIRGILETGVTVWSDPAEINAVDFATNEPLKGVSY